MSSAKVDKKKLVGFNLFQSLFWIMIITTIFVVITPSAEQDKGILKKEKSLYTVQPMASHKSTEFVDYLRRNGYSIVQDNFPIFIEVEKQQVDGVPEKVVQQLAEQCYKMTGVSSKVILRTLGARHMGQYSP